jgi:hypothetical protein
LSDDYPQVERLAFVEELPENLIVVALEIAEGKAHALFVNTHQCIEIVIFGHLLTFSQVLFSRFGHDLELELPLVDVDLVLEERSHIAHILEEGTLHQRYLAVEARYLRTLIDEVQQRWRNVDHLDAHDLEELSKQLAGLLNEIYHDQFIRAIVVLLLQKEMLHVCVVVLAEELQEAEGTAESQFV